MNVMKPIRIRKPLEREIVVAILQLLDVKFKHFCWCRVEPASSVRARVNRGKPGTAWKVPEDAWSNGVADILGTGRASLYPAWNNHAIAFEVKRPGEQPRPSQLAFKKRWETAGGYYLIIHSPEEAMAAMKNWGVT